MNREYIKTLPVVGKILHVVHNQFVQIKVAIKRYPVYKAETAKAMKYLDGLEQKSQRVFFCAVPIHNNLGDQAQAYCIRKWIREHYPQHELCEFAAWPFYNSRFCKKFEKIVSKENVLIIQSGYCTYEGHYNHKVHRYLVNTFTENRIVIMPQTVNFRKQREGFKTGEIYKKHPRLLFLSRDKKSDQYAHYYFDQTRIMLYPDIVTSLIGTMQWELDRNGIVLCVRNDGEKLYTNQQITKLKEQFSAIKLNVRVIDTDYPPTVTDYVSDFETCFYEKLQELGTSKVVITDRYHGTIFSLITNTPVIVLSTRDHKVKTGTEWFEGIYTGSYFNADSLEDAFNIAIDILNHDNHINNTAFFKKKYYDRLPDFINEL